MQIAHTTIVTSPVPAHCKLECCGTVWQKMQDIVRLGAFMLQIPHLVELGINAVELLPVFEYDELEFQRIPNPRDHMVNIWGYSHINFFAPMSRYAADGAGPAAAAKEFKEMVQQLHKAGIEVILDVVYNHTAEGMDVELATRLYVVLLCYAVGTGSMPVSS